MTPRNPTNTWLLFDAQILSAGVIIQKTQLNLAVLNGRANLVVRIHPFPKQYWMRGIEIDFCCS
jgi:hypothetical protein